MNFKKTPCSGLWFEWIPAAHAIRRFLSEILLRTEKELPAAFVQEIDVRISRCLLEDALPDAKDKRVGGKLKICRGRKRADVLK